MFKNPILGVLVGLLITAILQSSSASVGILQALTVTGQVSYGAAIIHLSFNIIGTVVWLAVFSILSAILKPAILDASASYLGIAVAHSVFNILCTLLLLPMSSLLEKLALKLVPDAKKKEEVTELDERLLVTPAIALDRCNALVCEMASELQRSWN